MVRAERPSDSPGDVAWSVLARPATIDEYADNISPAETRGEGRGISRRCWDTGGNGWDETSRRCDAGEASAFEGHTVT